MISSPPITGASPATTKQRLRCARPGAGGKARPFRSCPNPERVANSGDDDFAYAFARIECHYFHNKGSFARTANCSTRRTNACAAFPATIVHGRYDMATPLAHRMGSAQGWPEADLKIVADAGHTASEPGIAEALVAATDRYR